jgi:hypothetical protein
MEWLEAQEHPGETAGMAEISAGGLGITSFLAVCDKLITTVLSCTCLM